MWHKNILEAIGNTPMIQLNKVVEGIPATVLAKVEYFNPGQSVKDRMALKMVEDAEKAGLLKPGGTIIEGTSGNTGMGLALAAIVKGYKLICTMNDKQSKEKMDILRAVGAEVVVCPTNVGPDHPDSYYSVAKRLNQEIPNSFYPNQYDNLSNWQAHYETTGPEIWEQTEGKVTHFIVGVGTGGTISGVGKYLKEKNPDIKIWGIDTYGSVFKKYKETGEFDENEIYSYITEGIGEDILPANVDFNVIDRFEKVTDKDGALMAREIALQEGLFLGYSSGSAIAGLHQLKHELKPTDVVVVLFHDHGSRYVGKLYNDDWMRERGFLTPSRAINLIEGHREKPLITANAHDRVSVAMDKLTRFGISQLPVVHEGKMVGCLDESSLFSLLVKDQGTTLKRVDEIMSPALPEVDGNASIEEVAHAMQNAPAVLTRDAAGSLHIITKQDLIAAIRK